jgi:hypothetical protein
MRTRTLPFVLCGLLIVTGATQAAPPPADRDEARVADYVKALKSKNASVRKQVALALGDLGTKATSAVPALRGALLDADEGVQAAAAAALDKVNVAGKEAGGTEVKKPRDDDLIEAARQKAAVEREQDAMEQAKAEAQKLRDRAVAAEAAAKVLQQRNEQLLQRVEELTKEIARLRKDEKPAGGGPKPAPANVEGTVTAVDAKTGLVTLSVGGDAGLLTGNKLDAYRLKPSAIYLGQVQLVEVTATQAVGKPLGKAKDALQVGDSVSSGVTKK